LKLNERRAEAVFSDKKGGRMKGRVLWPIELSDVMMRGEQSLLNELFSMKKHQNNVRPLVEIIFPLMTTFNRTLF
jgi:hypothetical protein